jgi:hypothetical protein
MTHDKLNIIALLGVTFLLLLFVTYPIVRDAMIPLPCKIAKEPDEPKRYDDLLARGGVPKSLLAPQQPSMIQSLANACSPVANILGALSPIISFAWAIILWVKKR